MASSSQNAKSPRAGCTRAQVAGCPEPMGSGDGGHGGRLGAEGRQFGLEQVKQ